MLFHSRIAEDILAEHLVGSGAVLFFPEAPLRLKSGLITPIYVDNRTHISHPEAWHDIIETMASRIKEKGLEFDVIAGVEGAGVSHAAALAYRLNKPHVFVRQEAKTYGNKSRIEGGDIKGKRVLIIEDHISTGLSLLSAVAALREEGALVENCLAITSFEMDETIKLFEQQSFKMHEMIAFEVVIDKAVEMGKLQAEQKETLMDWLANPWTWASRHGLVPQTTEN